VFTFPTNLRRWFSVFITSAVMSLIHGAIFWNVRSTHHGTLAEQEDINDRLAFHYVLGSVAIWPTLMLMISDVWKERDSVARDVKDRLFGRWVHFVSKVDIHHCPSILLPRPLHSLCVSLSSRDDFTPTNQKELQTTGAYIDIAGKLRNKDPLRISLREKRKEEKIQTCRSRLIEF
jgi:hypothetical protein